jgi:chemotaxis protein CheX
MAPPKKNILIINEDLVAAYDLQAKLGVFKTLELISATNFEEALSLMEYGDFFAILFLAKLEINTSESFLKKATAIAAASNSKYLIFLDNLKMTDVEKFNYKSFPLAKVVASSMSFEEVSRQLAELVKNSVPPKKASFDVQFMNPFIVATTKTLETMCFAKELTTLSPQVFSPKLGLMLDISGSLVMDSPVFKGRLSICFNKNTFLKLTGNMFGETYSEITTEIEDAAAELTNIIYGQTKVILSEKGYEFNKSFPKVITGTENFLQTIGSNTSIVIPFRCKEGLFFIIVTLL